MKSKPIKKWKRTSQTVLGHNPYFDYVLETYRLPDGRTMNYHAVRKDHAVNMVGVTEEGKIVLVRQYRALFDRISLELPGGGAGGKEKPLAAAKREFFEETGYRVVKAKEVGVWATDNSMLDEVIHTFLFSKLKEDEKIHDPDEHTEIVLMTPAQLDKAIADGTIWHGQSIVSWHLARPHLT